MAKMSSSKFIVTKSLSMGFIKQSLPIGTIIEVRDDKKAMIIGGKTYNDLRDFTIASKIKDGKGNYLLIPYDAENPVIKGIAEIVKTKLTEKDEIQNKKLMPIIHSDRDLIEDVPLTHPVPVVKVAAKDIDPYKKMEVINDSEDSSPIDKKTVAEKEKEIFERLAKGPKMQVLKDSLVETSALTLAEKAKAKVKQAPASVTLNKKV